MDRLRIRGGRRLEGAVPISGAKNAALKLMVACLLTDEPLSLARLPHLADTAYLTKLLIDLGADVTIDAGAGGEEGDRVVFQVKDVANVEASYDLVRKMRATFNVLGPLLAREGRARVSLPGGCAIGARPVDQHLKALEAMGAEITLEGGYVNARAPRGLTGAEIAFPFVTVGGTEHAMLAAVRAKGETVLTNAACEPEIADLAQCLNAMGARITGAGTSTIRIEGVDRLHGARHRVMADRIESGAFAIACALTGGDILLEGAAGEDWRALIAVMVEAGVTLTDEPNGVRVVSTGARPKPVDVVTKPFPGFATDLQAPFMALMTRADGRAAVTETIFENRFMHVPELNRLGADIAVDGRTAHIRGVEHLTGAPVMATDLRASISLVLAGLVAKGETVVNRIYHLDRGYERLEEKLTRIGADVERIGGED